MDAQGEAEVKESDRSYPGAGAGGQGSLSLTTLTNTRPTNCPVFCIGRIILACETDRLTQRLVSVMVRGQAELCPV